MCGSCSIARRMVGNRPLRLDVVCVMTAVVFAAPGWSSATPECDGVRELFEREARTLLSLRHAGIPAFHAFFFHEGRCYLVEDFIAGRTLAQELEAKGRFSEAEVVAVVDEVLAILEYLHGRVPAVIHRDIKPANIIQAAAGGLYLVDFGAVKEAMVVAALSAESTIIGTSGYTPPEQLRGLVVPASDLYAVGATALHLLTGRSPAELYNVSEGAWRFTGQLGVSPRVEAIIAGLVEEQLARRFQTAAVVREMLRGGPVEASPTRAMSSSGLGGRPRDVESAPRATTASPKSLRPGAPAGWRVAPLVGALVVLPDPGAAHQRRRSTTSASGTVYIESNSSAPGSNAGSGSPSRWRSVPGIGSSLWSRGGGWSGGVSMCRPPGPWPEPWPCRHATRGPITISASPTPGSDEARPR